MTPRSASNAAWLVPGSRLDRYELLLPIAEGGMAMLWLARQQGKHGFDRVVAIKTILPKLAAEPGFRQMFLDEARVASRIEHVHVAQVLDLGEENAVLFMAMEWVDSESLINVGRAVARAKTPTIPIGILGRIMIDACTGLHAAHELKDDEGRSLNVVHRDISPHNLLITYRGTTKVIDFGIAKARNRLSHDTNVGTVKGKIAYMAPEQAMGLEVDRRADVWGAGATLYRYLAGRAPYSASNPVATLRLLTSGQPPPPLPSTVPPEMRAVVEKALELDIERRFTTMDEMRVALEQVLSSADMRTAHTDVEAFMAEHLGESRAKREGEIARAVRESRSRTRATMRRSPSATELAQSSRSEWPPAGEAITRRPPGPENEAPTRPHARKQDPLSTDARLDALRVQDEFDKRSTTKMRPQPGPDADALPPPPARRHSGEFAPLRQPLLTPAALQVAPLALRESSGARGVDETRGSAPRLLRPPTPAWIRIQPALASRPSVTPEDAQTTPPPGMPVEARAEVRGPRTGGATTSDGDTGETIDTVDIEVVGALDMASIPIPLRTRRGLHLPPRAVKALGLGAAFLGLVVILCLSWPATPSAGSAPNAVPSGSAASAGSVTTGGQGALVDRARQAQRDGRADEARELFTAAIAQDPHDAGALTGLAELEQAQGATADAIADFRRALAADGTLLPARLGLADLLWGNGQRVEARTLYRSIVDHYPVSACPDRARARVLDTGVP